ncbi:SAM-dependent methyltransferase [Arcanobacterium haemolyticum]|nr:class I SAM-dependent methyltransferase [Arcanobacterium haemolyticum]
MHTSTLACMGDKLGGMDAKHWEEKYAATERLWSGEPNSIIASHVLPWAPGMALDVGCGEGRDAVWLAQRGWRVRGIDFSETAISRMADATAESGVADAVEGFVGDACAVIAEHGWRDHDLATVSFIQSADLPRILECVSSTIVPGGRMLVAAHAFALPWHPDTFVPWSASDVIAAVDLPDFEVEKSSRVETLLAARGVTRVDDVVVFRRRMAE